jgi:hypothetical protein
MTEPDSRLSENQTLYRIKHHVWLYETEEIRLYTDGRIFCSAGMFCDYQFDDDAVYERVREIGILSAMGFTPGEISRLFFLEALLISLISAAVGMILGGWLVYKTAEVGIHLGDMPIFETAEIDYPTVFRPVLNLKTILISALMAIGITSLVALIPARKAARMEPVDDLNA